MVVIANTIKFREKDLRLESELPYLTYNRPRIYANTAQIIKLNIKLGIAFGEKPERLSAINVFISFIRLCGDTFQDKITLFWLMSIIIIKAL